MQRIRVTLDFEVYQDFDARQIDYETLFDIDGQESLTVTVEELHDTKVDSYWEHAYSETSLFDR